MDEFLEILNDHSIITISYNSSYEIKVNSFIKYFYNDPTFFSNIEIDEVFEKLNEKKFNRSLAISSIVGNDKTMVIDLPSLRLPDGLPLNSRNRYKTLMHRLSELIFINDEIKWRFIILTNKYASFGKHNILGGEQLLYHSHHVLDIDEDINIIKSRNFSPKNLGKSAKLLRKIKLNDILNETEK